MFITNYLRKYSSNSILPASPMWSSLLFLEIESWPGRSFFRSTISSIGVGPSRTLFLTPFLRVVRYTRSVDPGSLLEEAVAILPCLLATAERKVVMMQHVFYYELSKECSTVLDLNSATMEASTSRPQNTVSCR